MKVLGVSKESYFAHNAISNSRLGDIDLNTGKFKPAFTDHAKSFGSLVDAILTQRQDVDTQHPDYSKESKMVEMFLKDPFAKQLYENSQKQVMYLNEINGLHLGQPATGYCKCLYDIDLSGDSGWDLKTGAFYDMKGFLNLIDLFDWDRQAAFYIDVSEKKMHGIIALSKKVIRPPFRFVIKKGDEIYMRGRKKYMERLWMLNLIGES
jgi:hypothetical protein